MNSGTREKSYCTSAKSCTSPARWRMTRSIIPLTHDGGSESPWPAFRSGSGSRKRVTPRSFQAIAHKPKGVLKVAWGMSATGSWNEQVVEGMQPHSLSGLKLFLFIENVKSIALLSGTTGVVGDATESATHRARKCETTLRQGFCCTDCQRTGPMYALIFLPKRTASP